MPEQDGVLVEVPKLSAVVGVLLEEGQHSPPLPGLRADVPVLARVAELRDLRVQGPGAAEPQGREPTQRQERREVLQGHVPVVPEVQLLEARQGLAEALEVRPGREGPRDALEREVLEGLVEAEAPEVREHLEQTDRQTDRQRGTQTDRQTVR